MSDIATTIGSGGRIVIPAEFRKALGAEVGDEVILRQAGKEIHILTRAQAVRKAQELVRKSIPAKQSLAGELLRQRRKDAHNE